MITPRVPTTAHTIAIIARPTPLFPIDTVLLKVASRCNINCSYCYVYNMGDTGWAFMPKLMSPDTLEATVSALSRLLIDQHVAFAVVLHGGEPLLLGPRRLERFLSSLRAALAPACTLNIQTNGMLISDQILDICASYDCSLSISLDGPAEIHDRWRLGHTGQPTHDCAVRGIDKLRRHPSSSSLFSGLLAVIDPTSDPMSVYQHLKSMHPPSVDFLYRDGNHNKLPPGKRSLHSTEYGSWLCELFDIYVNDPTPPKIRLLDDVTKLILGGASQKEGVGLTDFGILVIETDGTIAKNDTLKSSYNGADRFQNTWSVYHHQLSKLTGSDDFAQFFALQRPSSNRCTVCPELTVCGGGMPLHRWSEELAYANPSIYCSDQLLLINHIRNQLNELGVSV